MKKILIVDDHPKIRELVSVTFSGIGDYQIFEAESGEAAMDLVEKEKPDLLLLDVEMHGELNGIDVTRKIKSNPETKECLVILLTAKGQDSDKILGRDAGADGYFVKPFNPTDLIRKVEEFLE